MIFLFKSKRNEFVNWGQRLHCYDLKNVKWYIFMMNNKFGRFINVIF